MLPAAGEAVASCYMPPAEAWACSTWYKMPAARTHLWVVCVDLAVGRESLDSGNLCPQFSFCRREGVASLCAGQLKYVVRDLVVVW